MYTTEGMERKMSSMISVTEIQRQAVDVIAADSLALGVAQVTLRALERKDLIEDLSHGNCIKWRLTSAGQLLRGVIADASASGPQQPTDPFAAFPRSEF